MSFAHGLRPEFRLLFIYLISLTMLPLVTKSVDFRRLQLLRIARALFLVEVASNRRLGGDTLTMRRGDIVTASFVSRRVRWQRDNVTKIRLHREQRGRFVRTIEHNVHDCSIYTPPPDNCWQSWLLSFDGWRRRSSTLSRRKPGRRPGR